MARYLLWLALEVDLRIGKWSFVFLNWTLRGLRISSSFWRTAVLMIEIVSWEARWLPDISACSWLTAPLRDTSLYSLYMLWFPVRDWYLRTMPNVLTWLGLLSKISLTVKIWPWALLVLSWRLRWYQNLVLAITLLAANRRMAYTLGLGSASVGFFRPKTRYCRI